MQGLIFDIDHYAIHDGPGIRTLIFLKGCPLSCHWCANPEGIDFKAEIAFFPRNCIGCNYCIDSCENNAIDVNTKEIIRSKCNVCGKCTEGCYTGARKVIGKTVTTEEVMQEVKKMLPFYQDSGGGVTLSGGEVTAQINFAIDVLKHCVEAGINTAIETSGYTKWDNLLSILDYVGLCYFDLKHASSSEHKKRTGVGNELILDNLVRVSQIGVDLIIRIPVLPGYNDTRENIVNSMGFIKNNLKCDKLLRIELLPYHKMGEFKYYRLGKEYKYKGVDPPTEENLDDLRELVMSYGFICQVGG